MALDRFIVDWLYGEVPQGGTGQAALNAKAQAAENAGFRYVSDADSRPLDAAQPWGSLWDDGSDPVAALDHIMNVRKIALDSFGLRALERGEPSAKLRSKYVPIYLLHRYQIDAAAKLLGAIDYGYSVAGDGRERVQVISAEHQRRALEALLRTLDPSALDTPEQLLPLLSSGWSGPTSRQFEIEVFQTQGGPVFDPLVAVDVAASLTLSGIVAPYRLNRLLDQHRRDKGQLSPSETLDRLITTVFEKSRQQEGCFPDVRRRIQVRTVLSLEASARNPALSRSIAAEMQQRLNKLATTLSKQKKHDAIERAHQMYLVRLIRDRHELDRILATSRQEPSVPPGAPIGSEEDDWFTTPVSITPVRAGF